MLYDLEAITGIGWRDEMEIDGAGGYAKAIGHDVLSASIKRVLTTAFGERVMMPTFGSNLPLLLFDPMDEVFAEQLKIATITALRKWEPRIELLSFRVAVDTVDDNAYTLVLNYKITGTDDIQEWGFKFRSTGFRVLG